MPGKIFLRSKEISVGETNTTIMVEIVRTGSLIGDAGADGLPGVVGFGVTEITVH